MLIILSIPSKSNRGNKYKIVAKYMKETFCSEDYSIWLDEIIEKWDNIDVYIDENDHSKYWMDVDTLFKEKSEMMEAQYGK